MLTCLPTPEAISKLNLEVIVTSSGECISAKSRNRYIVDELVEKGYIESYHAEYGLTLLTLREVWLGKLNGRTAKLSDEIAALSPHISAHELYEGVVRITRPRNVRIISWAIRTPAGPVIASIGEICRRSFDILADAFTETHKSLASAENHAYNANR